MRPGHSMPATTPPPLARRITIPSQYQGCSSQEQHNNKLAVTPTTESSEFFDLLLPLTTHFCLSSGAHTQPQDDGPNVPSGGSAAPGQRRAVGLISSLDGLGSSLGQQPTRSRSTVPALPPSQSCPPPRPQPRSPCPTQQQPRPQEELLQLGDKQREFQLQNHALVPHPIATF